MTLDRFIIAGLILALLFSVTTCYNSKKEAEHRELNTIAALNEQIAIGKDREGRHTAKVTVLVTELESLTEASLSKDVQLQHLQDALKKAGKRASSAVAFRASTTVTGSTPTINVPRGTLPDSALKPTYTGQIAGLHIEARPDSIRLTGSIDTDFTVSIAEKGGFLRRSTIEAEITSYNNLTRITEAKAYQKPSKKKSGVFWAVIGFISGVLVVSLR